MLFLEYAQIILKLIKHNGKQNNFDISSSILYYFYLILMH